MKKQFPKDIIIIILLTLVCTLFIYTLPLENYPLTILSYIFLGLFLPGYALLAAIYPIKQELGWFKRIFGSIAISVLLTLLLVFMWDYNILTISLSNALIIIGILTIILSIDALEGNMRNSKINEGNHRIFDENGIYKLKHSMKDIYIIIFFTIISLIIVSLPSKYIGGYFFYPVKAVSSLLIVFFSGIAFLIVIVTITNIAKSKQLLFTIIWGILILVAYSFFFKLNTLNKPNIILIIILSSFIVLMCLISFLRRKKIPKIEKKEFKNRDQSTITKYETLNLKNEKSKTFVKDSKLIAKTDQILSDNHESQKKLSKKLRSLDLVLVFLTTFICLIIVLTPRLNESILNIIAILIILFLPGYSLVAALYPKKEDLNSVERASLSFGFPIIVFSSGILIKNINPIAISLPFILILVTTFILVFIIVAYLRRRRVVENEEFNARNFEEKAVTEQITPEIEMKKSQKKISHQKFVSKDLLIIFLTTLVTLVFILTPKLDDTSIKTILGLFLILLLPGYSLIAALYPKKDDLDVIERVGLSFGLSIVITALIGLALRYTQWGTKLTPILILLSVFTVIMAIIGYIRRKRVPEGDKFYVNFSGFLSSIKHMFKVESKTSKIISIILLLSIILAVSTTAYILINPKQGETFTEFYILGPGGQASGYPSNITVGQNSSVIIGIVNHEQKTVNYNLVISSNVEVMSDMNITLTPGNKTEIPYTFSESTAGLKKVDFSLYKLPDNTNIYRSLHLIVNVT
jgi:uncharacterized membrane protein